MSRVREGALNERGRKEDRSALSPPTTKHVREDERGCEAVSSSLSLLLRNLSLSLLVCRLSFKCDESIASERRTVCERKKASEIE